MVKIVSARQAADMIPDGATFVNGGFIGATVAEEIAAAIETRFEETGSPKNLTVIFCACQGDRENKGLNHFAAEGLLSRAIGGHWGLAPKIGRLVSENKIEAYMFPQGVIGHIIRDSAARRPGTLTRIGLLTFVDPRLEGGKANERTKRAEDLVELMKIDGEEYLFYKRQPINFALLAGTYADENGNISIEHCAMKGEMLAAAMAAKNNGGTVVVQVEGVVKAGTLDPHKVEIPGALVDAVVPVSDLALHMQTFNIPYNPALSGEAQVKIVKHAPIPLTEKKMIARRAAMELKHGTIVNLGIGSPEFISNVAAEEGITDYFTLTVEAGIWGGSPLGDLSFGTSMNPECIVPQPSMFDFYQGGGLDQAFLGFAEVNSRGDINVSKFGPKIPGSGGFIDITQSAKEICFCGTFTAGGLKVHAEDGKLVIDNEGKVIKFCKEIEQITFSAAVALKDHIPVLYITERAVFRLTKDGLMLIEIAPGIDLEKDIFEHMGTRPIVSENLKLMDEKIFRDHVMGLKQK